MAMTSRAAMAARVYCALVTMVMAFQFALAAGAPWGSLAMGGAYPGQFPPALRVAAVVQAFLLALFALVVAARARLLLPRWHAASRRLVWVIVALSVVAVVLNAITPSAMERAIWLPVTLVMLVCSTVVARGS